MPNFSEVIDVVETYIGNSWEQDDYSHEIDFLNCYANLKTMMWDMAADVEAEGWQRAR